MNNVIDISKNHFTGELKPFIHNKSLLYNNDISLNTYYYSFNLPPDHPPTPKHVISFYKETYNNIKYKNECMRNILNGYNKIQYKINKKKFNEVLDEYMFLPPNKALGSDGGYNYKLTFKSFKNHSDLHE